MQSGWILANINPCFGNYKVIKRYYQLKKTWQPRPWTGDKTVEDFCTIDYKKHWNGSIRNLHYSAQLMKKITNWLNITISQMLLVCAN